MLTEQDLVAALRAADAPGLARMGLRFDRVVVRVVGQLRAFAEEEVPARVTVLLALTAPIRRPARSTEDLMCEIRARIAAGPALEDWCGQVNGTQVRLRLRAGAAPGDPRLLGFVHNRTADAGQILDWAERWLHTAHPPPPG